MTIVFNAATTENRMNRSTTHSHNSEKKRRRQKKVQTTVCKCVVTGWTSWSQYRHIIMMTENCFLSSSSPPPSSSSSWRRYNLFFNGNIIIYLQIFIGVECCFFFLLFVVEIVCSSAVCDHGVCFSAWAMRASQSRFFIIIQKKKTWQNQVNLFPFVIVIIQRRTIITSPANV